MLPQHIGNLPSVSYTSLPLQHKERDATTTNLDAITAYSDKTARLELASAVPVSDYSNGVYSAGQYCTIASATNTGNNGTFLITAIDTENDYVIIKNPDAVTESSTSATIAGAVTGNGKTIPGAGLEPSSIIRNRNTPNNNTIAKLYDVQGYYAFQLGTKTAVFQLVVDSGTSVTLDVFQSNDLVNFDSLANDISDEVVTTSKSIVFGSDEYGQGTWIIIDVKTLTGTPTFHATLSNG